MLYPYSSPTRRISCICCIRPILVGTSISGRYLAREWLWRSTCKLQCTAKTFAHTKFKSRNPEIGTPPIPELGISGLHSPFGITWKQYFVWRRRDRNVTTSSLSSSSSSPSRIPQSDLHVINIFQARQLYRQVLQNAISYGDSVRMSVHPSVRPSVTTRYRFKPRWDRDSGFPPYDSPESLVSYEVIWCRRVKRFPLNEGIKKGYPLRNGNFTAIGSSSVRTVADRHRLAAYHNKHCWRAFRCYQHWWPWTTLNPKIGVAS